METTLPAPPKHREAILRAAMRLFRRQGYSGTGLKDIVELSGAPKGSLYHYFPGGKSEIAAAAIAVGGANATASLVGVSERTGTAGAMVAAYADLLAGWLAQSGYRDGSPMTAVLLEAAPDDERVTAAGQAAFAEWRRVIAERLVSEGAAPDRAGNLAALAISALEGSLVQARVDRDAGIVTGVGQELARLLDRETGTRQ